MWEKHGCLSGNVERKPLSAKEYKKKIKKKKRVWIKWIIEWWLKVALVILWLLSNFPVFFI